MQKPIARQKIRIMIRWIVLVSIAVLQVWTLSACEQEEFEPPELPSIIIQEPARPAGEALIPCGLLSQPMHEGRICMGPNGPEVWGDQLGRY